MKVVRSTVLIAKLDTSFFSILIAMCMIWSMYYFVINNLETYVLYAFVIIFCFWNMWSVFGGHSRLLHVYCELTIFFQTKKNFHLNAKNFTWKEDSFQLMEDDTNRLDVLLSASRWHGGMVLSRGRDYVFCSIIKQVSHWLIAALGAGGFEI